MRRLPCVRRLDSSEAAASRSTLTAQGTLGIGSPRARATAARAAPSRRPPCTRLASAEMAEAPRKLTTTGLPHSRAASSTRLATLGAGGFDTSTITRVAGSAADTDRLGYSFTTGIDQAGHLLQAGTGGADQSNASRAHGVSKPERQPT